MTTNEMNNKIKELRELRRMSEELQAEIEALQDSFKAEMSAQGVDTLAGTDWKISWKEVQSSRLDSKALKASLPENPLKCEYFLPFVVDELIREDKAEVTVLKSRDRWYGVTYQEDKGIVMQAISDFKKKGVYPCQLWED